MSKHFRFQMIPAGQWKRIGGEIETGPSDEARPHFIPQTAEARALLALDAFHGVSEFCPGFVSAGETEELAYRFQYLHPTRVKANLAKADALVERLVDIVLAASAAMN